jgi:hypothetical protein
MIARIALSLLLVSAASADTSLPGAKASPSPKPAARSWKLRWPSVLPCAKFEQAVANGISSQQHWEWRGDDVPPLPIQLSPRYEKVALPLGGRDARRLNTIAVLDAVDSERPDLWLGLQCRAGSPEGLAADVSWHTNTDFTTVEVHYPFAGQRPTQPAEGALAMWGRERFNGRERQALLALARDWLRALSDVIQAACARGCSEATGAARDHARALIARPWELRAVRMDVATGQHDHTPKDWHVIAGVGGADTVELDCYSSTICKLMVSSDPFSLSYSRAHKSDDGSGDYDRVDIGRTHSGSGGISLFTDGQGGGHVELSGDAVALEPAAR